MHRALESVFVKLTIQIHLHPTQFIIRRETVTFWQGNQRGKVSPLLTQILNTSRLPVPDFCAKGIELSAKTTTRKKNNAYSRSANFSFTLNASAFTRTMVLARQQGSVSFLIILVENRGFPYLANDAVT